MKKVLLVNSNTEIVPYPVAPLGISLVAVALKDKYNVKVFDVATENHSLLEAVKSFQPQYIGIGLRNIDNVTMLNYKNYIGNIKETMVDPLKSLHVPIIIGGSGFSIAPEELMAFFGADYGIIGEAEGIFPVLLSLLDEGKEDIVLERVVTKNKGLGASCQWKSKGLQIPKADIDRFIDIKPYISRGSYPLQSKRGCSHHCIYCSYPNIEGTNYRLRPVNEIVDEMEEVAERVPGVSFEFVDSTFNSPLGHAVDICREIYRRGLKVKLRTMGINPGDITHGLISWMKKAGFTQIDCTPDSAADTILKRLRKNFGKKQLAQAAQIIREHDMPTMWFFMMGAPGETEKTVMETFGFIDQYVWKEDMVHITEGIRIIPYTELYDIALKEEVISPDMDILGPMFYVSPSIGKAALSELLKREIAKRDNVVNSINTAPSPGLLQKAMEYREKFSDEPLFRTLLRIKNQSTN